MIGRGDPRDGGRPWGDGKTGGGRGVWMMRPFEGLPVGNEKGRPVGEDACAGAGGGCCGWVGPGCCLVAGALIAL